MIDIKSLTKEEEGKKMCEALYKIVSEGAKTIKDLGEVFALSAKKLEEEN